MLNKDQKQDLEAGASAIQAGGNVTLVNVGITTAEARSIALDVAKATFYELSGVARDLASHRVEEITEKVISHLEARYPEGLQKAQDPDFQYALFTVQKEYARTGDSDLGDLLVDLLVDRSKEEHRDIRQIVLNESLAVAPKLTDAHVAALAICFLFRYTHNLSIVSYAKLGEYLDTHVGPYVGKLPDNNAAFQHLEYAGCGSILVGKKLAEILVDHYQGLFLKGFSTQDVENAGLPAHIASSFLINCLNDTAKLQVSAVNAQTLRNIMEQRAVDAETQKNLSSLFLLNSMSADEVREKVVNVRPYMNRVFDVWDKSGMRSLTLTSVGVAIGHAGVRRVAGKFADLSVWIS